MIDFACGNCDTRLRVGGALAGKKARCPKCREIIEVPKQTSARRRQVRQNCQRCNRPVLPNEMTRKVDGKLYCSYCLTDLGITSSGSMHDPTTLDIPGMVVLRGKEEREAARRFLDSRVLEKKPEDDPNEEGAG